MPRLKGEHRSVTGRDRNSRLSADRLSVFQLTVCLCVPVRVAAQEIADTSTISVDTAFVARDLDGDGAVDHVVRETRLIHMQENDPGDTIRMYGFRMAVYPGWPAMRFAFDSSQRRFRRTSGFECVRNYYLTESEPKRPPS